MATHSKFVKSIRVCRTAEEVAVLNSDLLSSTGLVTSVDTEWYDYDKDKNPVNNGFAFCATFSWRDREGVQQTAYVHNHGKQQGLIHELHEFFASDIWKTAHNVPVDHHVLTNEGVKLQEFKYDTMVMDHALDENRENKHGLKECAEDFLGHSREAYNRTFGSPKLRKDGQPMASGQLIVPALPEYTMGSEPVSLEEALAGKTEIAKRWRTLYEYSVADAYDGLLLYEFYAEQLRKRQWINGKTMYDHFVEVQSPLTDLLARMERRGMYLDLQFMREMENIAGDELKTLIAKISDWAEAPINPDSRPDLQHLLYGRGVKAKMKGKKLLYNIKGHGFPVLRETDGGDPSTKAEHLKELMRHLDQLKTPTEEMQGIKLIMDYSKRKKQYGTYLVGLQTQSIGNRVHGRLNQIGTTSGRLSSSNPNLQNISTGEKDLYHLRSMFRAPPGMLLIVADYSQLEYRLLAHMSQEPKLIDLFHKGYDLHSLTTYNVFQDVKQEADERFGGITVDSMKWIAEEFGDQRKKAKTLNFEIIYGVGNKKLADQLNISDAAAQHMIDGWFRGYPYVKAWMDRILNACRGPQGFLRTVGGRYRHANKSRLHSSNRGQRGEEERTLVNSGIQGSAADVVTRAMLNLDRDEAFNATGAIPIVQVHDELVFEVPRANAKRAIELMRPIMENPFTRPFRVPMPVSIGMGPVWAEAKS